MNNQNSATTPAASTATELETVAKEAASCLEAAAAHNRSKGRTVLAHSQQDRADRLRLALAAAQPVAAAPVAQAATETDMAHRLRVIAAAVKSNEPALVTAKCLTDAAAECDRFYNGMMNWKETAQAKDRIIIEQRAALQQRQAPAPSDGEIYAEVSRRADPEGYADALAVMSEIAMQAEAAPAPADEVRNAALEEAASVFMVGAVAAREIRKLKSQPSMTLAEARNQALDDAAKLVTEKGEPSFGRAILMLKSGAAPAPAEPVATNWHEAARIADLPAVDEALQGFSDDPTAENGICIVRAVLESLAPVGQAVAAVPATDERDALAQAIHAAAVKRGIIAADTAVTGPQLVMLCTDLASPAAHPATELLEKANRAAFDLLASDLRKFVPDGDHYAKRLERLFAAHPANTVEFNAERMSHLINRLSVANRRDGLTGAPEYNNADRERAKEAVDVAERNLLNYVKSIAAPSPVGGSADLIAELDACIKEATPGFRAHKAMVAARAALASRPAALAAPMDLPPYTRSGIACAIEAEIDAQLNASGMCPADMQRQDGYAILDIVLDAVEKFAATPATQQEKNNG